MATKKNEETIIINNEPMRKRVMRVKLVGDAPLIVHAWAEKAKKEILEKQQKKASKGKESRDPVKEFVAGLYILDEAGERYATMPEDVAALDKDSQEDEVNAVLSKYRYGFPAVAVKACMIDTAYQQGLIAKKTTARGAIRIPGEYIQIDGIPTIREDMVMIGGMSKVADLRYRPEFRNWSATVTIEYLENSVSAEQVFQWLQYGGFCSGIGEWRPSKDGSFGTFHPEA